VEATTVVGWCGLARQARHVGAGVAAVERKAGRKRGKEGGVREPRRSGVTVMRKFFLNPSCSLELLISHRTMFLSHSNSVLDGLSAIEPQAEHDVRKEQIRTKLLASGSLAVASAMDERFNSIERPPLVFSSFFFQRKHRVFLSPFSFIHVTKILRDIMGVFLFHLKNFRF
jgi:hypothetical protein